MRITSKYFIPRSHRPKIPRMYYRTMKEAYTHLALAAFALIAAWFYTDLAAKASLSFVAGFDYLLAALAAYVYCKAAYEGIWTLLYEHEFKKRWPRAIQQTKL